MFSKTALRKLIIPLFLEQLLVMFVGIFDTFMISFAGEADVSGVSLVNMLVTFFLYVFTALASGGAVIVSQYIGRHDEESANEAASQLLLMSILVSAISAVGVLIFNEQILNLLFGNIDFSVMKAGLRYQQIMAYSYLALGIYNSGAAVCRSINQTNVTLKISFLANIINIFGDIIGIFMFHAGVAGVAWPSFLARLFSAVVITIFCSNVKNKVHYTWRYVLTWHWEMLKRIFKVAIPNSIENGTFQLIKVALSSITALFGTSQIAANGIAQTIWSLSALIVVTMGPVYITVIGQCMGANKIDEAEYYFKYLTKLTVVTSVIWNIIIFMLTPLLMSIYPLSNHVKHLVVLLVLIHNVFSGLVWPFGGALPNGLRAAGDIGFTMYISIASTIFVRLVLSYLLGVVFNLGVVGIALAMVSDWIVRAIAFIIRYQKGVWKEKVII